MISSFLCRNFYSYLFELLRAVTRLRDISNELRELSREVNEVSEVETRQAGVRICYVDQLEQLEVQARLVKVRILWVCACCPCNIDTSL